MHSEGKIGERMKKNANDVPAANCLRRKIQAGGITTFTSEPDEGHSSSGQRPGRQRVPGRGEARRGFVLRK